MKISAFHLMPHRELPADFEQRYESVWVTPPWWELADARRVGQYYNWTLDELIHAADKGIDGICVNEHHQNAYGFMPNPDLMGSILARATNGTDVAVVQMGATLPTSNPPIRIAEEYSMIDCISGGRMVAGMPLGTSQDVNLCYGIPPIEQRERYYEAHDLILKAWQSPEIFAWNGKYFKLPMVNIWPRPIQKPHPPVWIPGSGSLSTWDFSAKHNHCYCFLSYWGNNFGKRVMDGFWDFVAKGGHDPNPYRAGFLQLVVVAESDAKAEELYYPHIRYFYDKCLHILWDYQAVPGNQDHRSLVNSVKNLYPMQLDLMRTWSATPRQVLSKLRWPSAVPFLFASLKVAITISLIGAIVAELPTGAEAGIGARLLAGSYYGQTIQIWAALLASAILASGLIGLVDVAEKITGLRMGARP